jgi:hypothetical protein
METVNVVPIDRLQARWQRDVPQSFVRDFGDERRRNFGGLPEIQQRPISLFNQPLKTKGGWCATTRQLEIDGDESTHSGSDAGRG